MRRQTICLHIIRTEHITDIDNNGSGLGRKGREDIAASKARMTFSAWANFKSILSVSLEQKSETADIGMASRSPGADGIFRCGIMNQAELRQAVGLSGIVRDPKIILSESEGDGKTRHLNQR